MRYVAWMMRNMLVRMIGLCWTRDSFSPTITFNTAWSVAEYDT